MIVGVTVHILITRNITYPYGLKGIGYNFFCKSFLQLGQGIFIIILEWCVFVARLFKLIFLKSAVCKVACCTEVRKNEYLCSPIIMGHT